MFMLFEEKAQASSHLKTFKTPPIQPQNAQLGSIRANRSSTLPRLRNALLSSSSRCCFYWSTFFKGALLEVFSLCEFEAYSCFRYSVSTFFNHFVGFLSSCRCFGVVSGFALLGPPIVPFLPVLTTLMIEDAGTARLPKRKKQLIGLVQSKASTFGP